MPTLAFLPGEIVSDILSWGTSFSVLELWKCGDTALNSRLERFVTHIDLKDTRYGTVSRFARVLTRFSNLRSLSIDRGSYPIDCTSVLRKGIQGLSKTLRSLKIVSRNAEMAFLLAEFAEGSLHLIDPSSEISGLQITPSPSQTVRSWNIVDYLPHLEEMTVSIGEMPPQRQLREVDFRDRFRDDLEDMPSITVPSLLPGFESQDFVSLPLDLKKLEWRGSCKLNDLSALPRGLESLTVPKLKKALAFQTLPPMLRTLTCHVPREAVQHLLFCEPKMKGYLQTFGAPQQVHSVFGPRLSSSELDLSYHVQSEPIRWTHGAHGLRYASWSQALEELTMPENLVHLKIGQSLDESFLPALLPHTLESLEVPSILVWKEVKAKDWPAGLKSLIFENTASFSPAHFFRLPRSLKVLRANLTGENMLLGLKDGTQTKEIAMEFWKRLMLLGRHSIKSHPEDLAIVKSLLHDDTTSTRSWASPVNLKAIAQGRLYGLPLTLESLHLFAPNRPALPLTMVLPPFVRVAQIPCTLMMSTQFVSELPLLLESLTFGINESPEVIKKDFSLANFECSSLTSLSVFNLRIESSSAFANLPRTLLSLEIGENTHRASVKVDKVMLASLPPSLTQLILGLTPIHVGQDWLGLLPRGLKTVSMERWHAPSSTLSLLPPKIESLSLRHLQGFAYAHLALLPTSVTFVSILHGCGGFDGLDWTPLKRQANDPSLHTWLQPASRWDLTLQEDLIAEVKRSQTKESDWMASH